MVSNEDARKIIEGIQDHINRMSSRLDVAEHMDIEYIDPRTPAYDSFLEDTENIKILVQYFDYTLRKSA